MTVQTISSLDQILENSRSQPNRLFALNFWTNWVDSCIHMNEVFSALASTNPSVFFGDVDAEAVADVSLHFCIEAVPTFVLLKNGAELKRINGAKSEELVSALSELQENGTKDMNHLTALINRHSFMIFIKGTPEFPRCGFTRQLVELLSTHGINFDYYNILEDEQVRQSLKVFSDWPTYPQIYIKGELLGGLDIFKEMIASGQLPQLLK